jgi:enoyl-CoA hydratase/carnithine racemase
MTRLISTSSPRLLASVEGAVANVVLNAPDRRNCVDLTCWQAIPPLFSALHHDKDVRVIVVRGAGDEAFCAGADIAEFEALRSTVEGSRAYEMSNVAAFDAVAACSKPVIALIQGFCFGAGVGLAAACDLRIAADDAVVAVPAARLGVGYPPTAMRSLVALMGPQPVKQLFFTGARLNAVQAHSAGLFDKVLAKATLEADVAALARQITAGAPMTIAAAKQAIDAAAGLPHARPASILQEMADACFASEDYAEGRRAFREKRTPVFKGR